MAPCCTSPSPAQPFGIAVLLCNIRGLRSKLDELENLIRDRRPHLVALTETWLSNDVLNAEVLFPGYECLRSDRCSRTGGGVLIYYLSDLCVTLLDSHQNASGTEEFLCCRVRCGSKTATVAVVYRSPGCDGTDTLHKIAQWGTRSNCLIIGDFNAPQVSWDSPQCNCPPHTCDRQIWTDPCLPTLPSTPSSGCVSSMASPAISWT